MIAIAIVALLSAVGNAIWFLWAAREFMKYRRLGDFVFSVLFLVSAVLSLVIALLTATD
jgi:hypothetical protein